jgi:ankyrin repeat protein
MNKSSIDLLIKNLHSSGTISASEVSSAGIDVNEVGSHGRTLLMAAASVGLSEAVDALVALGASVSAVGVQGMTALHEASANGHAHTLLLLLSLVAAVDTKTDVGVTPLMCAAAWGHVEVAKILLAHGANSKLIDDRGGTAADVAGEKGELAFVEFLDSLEL